MSVALQWRERAACRNLDPALFDPPSGHSEYVAAARQVCDRCPVRVECLEWALGIEGERAASYRAGIYGGYGAKARWEIQRCRRGECAVRRCWRAGCRYPQEAT